MAGITRYQKEKQLLEDAYARGLLLKYDIREVTTRRQALNGTREFEFPVSCFSKQMIKWNGVNALPKDRLRMAVFKSGYVRKQNGAYCAYPINKRYRQNVQHTLLTIKGELKTRRYNIMAYEIIHESIAMMNYMLNYYLKNYAK
jgi:hypothetical protein